MAKPKLYSDGKAKQKAYRERKKKSGFRAVLVLVPNHIFPFLKGEPSKLVDSFVTLHKNIYIEFDQLAFANEGKTTYAILGNKDGEEWKVTNADQIKILETFQGRVRLHVDGSITVVK